MIGGVFKFVLAIVVFFVAGIIINPAVGALFNGFQLPTLAVFFCQLGCAGLVVAKK